MSKFNLSGFVVFVRKSNALRVGWNTFWYSFWPFDENKIFWVHNKLCPAKSFEFSTRIEAISIDVYKLFSFQTFKLIRQIIAFHNDKCGRDDIFFHANFTSNRLCKCGLPCSKIARERKNSCLLLTL